jgi:hypothetical protein
LFDGGGELVWARAGADVPPGWEEVEGVVCACDEPLDVVGAAALEDGAGLFDASGAFCGVDGVWVCVVGEVVESFGACSLGV